MKYFAFLRSVGLCAALVAVSAVLSGCSKSEPARFRLNMLDMVENEVPPSHQQQIADILTAMYGTPDEPFVLPETELDLDLLKMAAGAVASDEQGQETGLFRRHCVHCHGISGDGAGPTAAFMTPYPRDYRQGKFKFKSTERSSKPTRDDLKRILVDGIPGTSMPSFALLPEEQIDALVEYVAYLSMRGETETQLARLLMDLGEDDEGNLEPYPTDPDFLIEEVLYPVVDRWLAAEDEVIAVDPETAPPADRSPQELAESIAKGRDLFYSNRANCASCHGPSGLGDGQLTDFDDWNRSVKEFAESHPDVDVASLGLLPVQTIKPRNLRQGIYRGGRRPIDLYRRIHAGINGVPMPGVGPSSPGLEGTLSPEEIWNLVDYVRAMPEEALSQPPKLPPALERERL